MKTFTLLLQFISISASVFSQQYPFGNCWLFKDTTIEQGSVSTIVLDSVGRVFMTMYDNNEWEYVILDENGNKISASPHPFNAIAKSGNYYYHYLITDTASATSIVIEKVSPFNNLIWRDTIGYGNNTYEYIYQMYNSGEDLIATGWSSDYGFKTFLFKWDEAGNIVWTNEIENEFPGPLIFLTSGNYLLQGHSYVTNIMTDGQILWQTNLNLPYYPTPSGLVEEGDGGCYVLTTTTNFDNPYANQFIIVDHLNKNGTVTTGTKYFYNQNISTIKVDSKGSLLLSSWLDFFGDSESLALRKINSDLNIVWEQYDYQSFPDNVDMKVDSHDNVYWLTTSAGYYGNNHGTLYKFNSEGTLEWQIEKNGSNSDIYHPTGLDVRKEEQLLLLGVDGPLFQNSSVLNLESIDLGGSVEWETLLDTVMAPVYASLTKLNDDEYYVAGKYYASPNQQGRFCLNLCVADNPTCLIPALLSSFNITSITAKLKWHTVSGALSYKLRYKIAGASEWTITKSINNHKTLHSLIASTEYAWQVKSFCDIQPVVSSDWSEKQFFTTDDLRLAESIVYQPVFEVYPNPVSHSATISFSINEASPVLIELMDLKGRLLRVIVKSDFSSGKHEVTFNRESLGAGVYFLQLKTYGGVIMKKVIVE